jgi:hypothetical protein
LTVTATTMREIILVGARKCLIDMLYLSVGCIIQESPTGVSTVVPNSKRARTRAFDVYCQKDLIQESLMTFVSTARSVSKGIMRQNGDLGEQQIISFFQQLLDKL